MAAPDARRMRRALIATFIGVVAALTTVGTALAIAVHGPLRTLEAIADDHGRAVQLTNQIRSAMSEARRTVVGEVAAPRIAAASAPRLRLYQLEEPLTELSAVCESPFEKEKLQALRGALRRSAAEAEAIEQRIASGDADGARDRLGAFLEVSGAANDATDAILGFNAVQVVESSQRVEHAISGLALAMLALSFAAAGGGYVLLRFALKGLDAHEAIWRARFTDLDAFAARAAHEMRTPLQALTLALASRDPSALERARRSTERMRTTVDALLEFSRAGVGPKANAVADVAAVVNEVQEDLAPLAAEQRATVTVDVPDGARAGVAPEHLRTILNNLVVNALRYGAVRPGGHVAIRVAEEEGWVRLEVQDDGPGIPESALPHVFEPFARGTDAPGGFGIGLATVRRLVEEHGGKIAVESAPERGTTVRLRLPRRVPERRDEIRDADRSQGHCAS
jgi:signal transduction histidine kinase